MGGVVGVAEISLKAMCSAKNVSCTGRGGLFDSLCDVSALGDCHAVVDDSRELPKSANLFPELRRRQTILARRELEIIVEPEFVELPCCSDTA